MPFGFGSGGVHDDTQHQGSAKRNTASGVKGIDAGSNLTPKTVMADIDAAILNAANGIGGLDAAGVLATAQIPVHAAAKHGADVPVIADTSFIAAGISRMVAVTGAWAVAGDASQTLFDVGLVTVAGLFCYNTAADGGECHFGEVALHPGTYAIDIYFAGRNDLGKVDIMIGATVIATLDHYVNSGPTVYDQSYSTNYVNAALKHGKLRFKVNGKNAASSSYQARISKCRIYRTA